MINFVTLIARKRRSFQNISAHISAIEYHLKEKRRVYRFKDSFRLTRLLRAIKRTAVPVHRYKVPISPRQLRRIMSYVTRWSFAPTLKFAIALTLLAMLRKSNVAPTSRYNFNAAHQLCFGDVMINHKGSHLLLRLKWSKTKQNDEVAIIRIPRLPGSPFCPIRLYREYLNYIDCAPERQSPLLLIRDNSARLQVVSAPFLNKYLRVAARELGLPSQDISLHSLRRTGAIIAKANGLEISDIKHMGTWSSDAIHCYLQACAHMFLPSQQAWQNM